MINTVLSKADNDLDEVWILEHNPVFTLGLGASKDDILSPGNIPVIRSDRGGQATYHGPGQLVAYFLLNLRRLGWGPKRLTHELEDLIINLLSTYKVVSSRISGAPGIYVDGAKIASIGLKIKRGISYHGISINLDMDLDPFLRINPCGSDSLKVTQLSNLKDISFSEAKECFQSILRNKIFAEQSL